MTARRPPRPRPVVPILILTAATGAATTLLTTRTAAADPRPVIAEAQLPPALGTLRAELARTSWRAWTRATAEGGEKFAALCDGDGFPIVGDVAGKKGPSPSLTCQQIRETRWAPLRAELAMLASVPVNLGRFRALCDAEGFPLVGNAAGKGDDGKAVPSAVCDLVRTRVRVQRALRAVTDAEGYPLVGNAVSKGPREPDPAPAPTPPKPRPEPKPEPKPTPSPSPVAVAAASPATAAAAVAPRPTGAPSAALLRLRDALADGDEELILRNPGRYRALCDAEGYPLVGNVADKVDGMHASDLCEVVRSDQRRLRARVSRVAKRLVSFR